MPELHWRKAGLGLKKLAEGLQVFKSQLIGNLADGEIGGRKFLLGQFDQLIVQMLLGVLAGEGFEQAAKVTGRNI